MKEKIKYCPNCGIEVKETGFEEFGCWSCGCKFSDYIETQTKEEKEEYEPYFGWCDVEGCENEGCCGGTDWRESGYWTICMEHSSDYRKGKPQPKMKPEAIEREKSRDPKTGCLPHRNKNGAK